MEWSPALQPASINSVLHCPSYPSLRISYSRLNLVAHFRPCIDCTGDLRQIVVICIPRPLSHRDLDTCATRHMTSDSRLRATSSRPPTKPLRISGSRLTPSESFNEGGRSELKGRCLQTYCPQWLQQRKDPANQPCLPRTETNTAHLLLMPLQSPHLLPPTLSKSHTFQLEHPRLPTLIFHLPHQPSRQQPSAKSWTMSPSVTHRIRMLRRRYQNCDQCSPKRRKNAG